MNNTVIVRVGQILRHQNQIFKIDSLFEDDDGNVSMVAECLTLVPEDMGRKWWTFEINDPGALELYTVH